MTMKARFAPSPTGYLHVGNCRTAIINWLFLRAHGGKFLLRMDDTDVDRSQKKYEEGILKDMAWLGLTFDEFYKQSDRFALYSQAVEKLKSIGRLYPCYETPEELDFKRKSALARGLPPIYDREALTLSDDQKKKFETQGRKSHWRFKLENGLIEWADLVRGHVSFEGAKLSDPVLIRENGTPVYTLASVVDDLDLGITHIIRGEDHVANTAIQIQLAEALSGTKNIFTFAHLPLVADESGEGLSKRIGSLGIQELRNNGLHPMALNSYLSKLGTSDDILPYKTMEKLIDSFDIKKYARGTPKFSLTSLEHINEKLLHHLSFEDVKPYLETADWMTPEFWELIRPNLKTFNDIKTWHAIFEGNFKLQFSSEDIPFFKLALEHLPKEGWDQDPWISWINVIKANSDRKGRNLFMPLRQALTGEDHGPELASIVRFLGHEKIKQRLYKIIN